MTTHFVVTTSDVIGLVTFVLVGLVALGCLLWDWWHR